MAWSPDEYGTATSISIFSKYFRLLLKRRPPRDMSSHATTSSASPGRRTHALKLTRVRTCFRRFSRSFSFTGSSVAATVEVSGPIQAAPANELVRSLTCRSLTPRSVTSPSFASSSFISRVGGRLGEANDAARVGELGLGCSSGPPDRVLPGAACFHSVEEPHFWQ